MMFCVKVIWADDTALNSTCDKPSDLSQQFEIAMSCNLMLKIWNAIPEKSENSVLHSIIYWYLGNCSIFTS